MSFVDLVFQVFMTWGKKAMVVKLPANKPIIVTLKIMGVIFYLLNLGVIIPEAIAPVNLYSARDDRSSVFLSFRRLRDLFLFVFSFL
jgi:hypothetical protein